MLTGNCYSCPSGYAHNPALPANVNGVCYRAVYQAANWAHAIGCPAGSFDGLNGSCYSCPGGYTHNPLLPVTLPGVCYTPAWKENTTMSHVGGRSYHCDTFLFGACIDLDPWSYYGTTSGGIWSGDNYYKCPNGYSHDIFVPFNNNGICFKNHPQVDVVANYSAPFASCTGNEFDGLNGHCYACPGGWNHNPLLTYNDPQVCSSTASTVASQQGPVTLACPLGQFLDVGTGDCYACPSNYLHDPVKGAGESGVCYKLARQAADYDSEVALLCPADTFADVVTGKCYSCPADYTWNPAIPVDQNGVCFKFAFGNNGPGSMKAGYETGFDYAIRWGVSGGITVDQGSVDVQYKPSVKLEVTEDPAASPGLDIFRLGSTQVPGASSVTLHSTAPSVTMFVDTYIDGHTKQSWARNSGQPDKWINAPFFGIVDAV